MVSPSRRVPFRALPIGIGVEFSGAISIRP